MTNIGKNKIDLQQPTMPQLSEVLPRQGVQQLPLIKFPDFSLIIFCFPWPRVTLDSQYWFTRVP